jgi:hypothetical protein
MKILLLLTLTVLASCGNPEAYVIADNSQITNIQNELDRLKIQITALELSDSNTQDDIEALIARIVALETATPVISVIDPCPLVASNSGYKEMLFELSDGKVIGYFESGSKRFLTEIKRGVSYQTTDDRACIFTL